MDNLLSDWRDYIRYAEILKYNFKRDSNLFPPDVLKAHNRARWINSVQHMEKDIVAIQKMSGRLNSMYRFAGMGFIIRAPFSADEIIKEGSELLHCVASYMDRIAVSETTILFIRREDKPDKPFFTLEIRDGRVRQLRGFDDCEPTAEVQNFVDLWEKKKFGAGKAA